MMELRCREIELAERAAGHPLERAASPKGASVASGSTVVVDHDLRDAGIRPASTPGARRRRQRRAKAGR